MQPLQPLQRYVRAKGTEPLNSATGTTSLKGIYLSGAPRLSTRSETESIGPRSHILGVIGAFREHGVELDQFIVGDTAPQLIHGAGSEKRLTASWVSILAADALRLVYRIRSRLRLRRRLGHTTYDFAYERYALFQQLGSVPQKRGAHWILEVNALLALESTSDRRATSSRRLATWAEGRTFRAADTIVAVTQALANQISLTYRIPQTKILVIANGVDHTRYDAVSTHPILDRPIRIGFVGTLYSWQNVQSLLTAISELGRFDVVLDIVGDGPELDALTRLSAEYGMTERVTFLGRMHPDAIPEFLSTIDICFAGHGSSNGAYFSPLKLWEYLAAGKPVLASAHEVTVELADQGFAVVCFGDSAGRDLDTALAEVLNSISELQKLAESRQPNVWDEYSWTARVKPLIEIAARA